MINDLFDVIVRPRTALLRSTALSIALSAVPLAVALVWVSFPLRMWAVVATFVLMLALLTVMTFIRLRTAFIGVGPAHIELRGLIGRGQVVNRASIDRIVTATTFTNSVDRLTSELVALDIAGVPILRLRGILWDEDSIARVIGSLGIQVTEYGKPVPRREFLQEFPDDRRWFEQHAAAVFTVLITGAIVAVVLAAEVSGVFTR